MIRPEIFFENKHEAISFCDYLFQVDQTIEVKWKHQGKAGSHLIIHQEEKWNNDLLALVQEALINVFNKHREYYWLEEIIKTDYHFKDHQEVEHIIEISRTIMNGEVEGIDPNKLIPKEELEKLMIAILEDQSFLHFDSFITFRMQNYKEELIEFAGIAIEEYKREQDYQFFIQSLREYISRRESICDHIRLIQGRKFTYVRDDGSVIHPKELKKIANHQPLYIFGLNDHELNIAPLLTLAPRRITLYGDDPTDPKTITVLNVFQERITFLSESQFPHDHQIP